MGRRHLVWRTRRPAHPVPPRRRHLRRSPAHTPGTVVAFRTDALYLTEPQNWPYRNRPGDYLLKGHLSGPVNAPTSEEELLTLRDTGRQALNNAPKEA